jgi:hypothetical protein
MEAIQNYVGMQALARAIVAAGTVNDVHAIRSSFHKAFPMLGDKFPTEARGITSDGRMEIIPYAQMVKGGKLTTPTVYVWWSKTQQEFNQVKKISKSTSVLSWKKTD